MADQIPEKLRHFSCPLGIGSNRKHRPGSLMKMFQTNDKSTVRLDIRIDLITFVK